MKVRILCTLGPSSLRPDVITRLDERGVDLFPDQPVAHAAGGSGAGHRAHPAVLGHSDLRGHRGRPGPLRAHGHRGHLEAGRTVHLTAANGQVGTAERLALQPRAALDALQPGSELSIDFNGARLRVTATGPDGATAMVTEGGQVRSNKAVTVDPAPALPALSDKDVQAIGLGASLGVGQVALSFASRAEDVALVRSLAGPAATVIAKLESRAGVRNMDAVISAADAVLIDRGDLSREIPLEQVPFYQKVVVRRANRWNRPVFVATNLLESMVTSRRPTVAEANDIANTLLDGVHGLVLAAIAAFECWNTSSLLEEDRQALAGLGSAR